MPVSILILAILIALLPIAEQVEWPQIGSTAPELTDIYTNPKLPMSMAAISGGTAVRMPDGVLPDFPQCHALNISDWCWNVREAEYEEGHMIEVNLMSEGRVVGNVQLLEMDIGYVELQEIMASYSDTVWLSAIKVARYARLNGIGGIMRQAADKVLAYLIGQDGVDRAYHVFFNSSGSETWMRSAYNAVAACSECVIIYEDAEMFIYEILAR
jgi:hypothetical protein